MNYILKEEGKKYLHSGKEGITVVDKLSKATKFSSQKKAENVMACLPKELKKKRFSVCAVEGTMVKPIDVIVSVQVDDQPVTVTKVKTKKKKVKEISAITETFEFDDKAIREHILSAVNEIKRMQEHREYLTDMVRKADLETSDIMHYLEFNKLSASEGYKISKQLTEIRQRRRKYKDMLGLLDIMDNEGKALLDDDFLKKINYVYNRTYEPRVLTDLFE